MALKKKAMSPYPDGFHDVSTQTFGHAGNRQRFSNKFPSSRDVSERLKGKVHAEGVLALLLYGYESRRLSFLRLSGDSVSCTTSESGKCAALPCARRPSTASHPKATALHD